MARNELLGMASGIGLALLAMLPLAAQAKGFWQTRASLSLGQYSFDSEDRTLSDGSMIQGTSEDGDIIAADLGGTLGFKLEQGSTVVLDLELEAMTVSADDPGFEFERVDLKTSAGYVLDVGLNLTPFVGFRYAWQGDGYFDDGFYTESGYLVGVGLTGIELGDNRMSVSLAFNDTTLDAGPIDTDASGFSFKGNFRLADTPLGFSLKYQAFESDFKEQGSFRFGGFEETYLLLSATWYFAQGRI